MKALLERDPKNPLALYGLANELFKLGEYAEARDRLETYLEIHDDEGAAFRLLALACERLDRIDDARDAYRRGVYAAERFGHISMVEEFQDRIDELDR